MLTALAPALLQGGLSLMSGMGARNAAAKQGRLQMMEDARVDQVNRDRQAIVDEERRRLGYEALAIPETTRETGFSEGYVNVEAMMAGAEAAGFNPASWLAAGALSAYSGKFTDMTTTRTGHNVAALYKLMMPEMVSASPSQIPRVPDMLEVFGNAGTAGLNTFNQLSRQGAQSSQQNALIQALAGIGGGRSSSSNSGGVFATPGISRAIAGLVSAGTGAPTTWGGAASGVASLALNPMGLYPFAGAYETFKSEDEKNKFLNPYGTGTFIDRTVPNADGYATRLGEPGEWLGAPRVGGRDAYINWHNGERTLDADIQFQKDRFGGPAWYAYPLAAGLAGVHYFRPSLTGGITVNWPSPSYNYDAWTPRASSSSAP